MRFRWRPNGKGSDLSSGTEIERALSAITAALNERGLGEFETRRVQSIVMESLGPECQLTVDDGGGVHDESGARIGAIRRTPSGAWITERQNEAAERAHTAIPSTPPESRVKKMMGRLKP